MRRVTLLAALLPILLAGCGNPPAVDLDFRYTDAQGATHAGTLACQRPKDSPTCARLLTNPDLLAPVNREGVSIDQYFGPEQLEVAGRIDGTQITETYRRTNGAEEGAFQRAADAVLPALGMSAPAAR